MGSFSEKYKATGKSPRRFNLIYLLFVFLAAGTTAHGQKGNVNTSKIVVIDAGHGGKDPGSVVGIAKEKNIVLDIALKLGNLIKQNQKNIKVVYTRDGDYFIPLMDRANIANRIHADLFISIHANYCSTPEINGTETYVLGLHRTEDNLNVAKKENSVILLEDNYSTRYEGFNPNLSESYIMFELIQDSYLDQSLRFASILQSNFKELAQRRDREVRQAGFLVLRETSMPSVLIETGYLSNKKENSFLLTDAGRSEIAHSIHGSLVSYLNKIDTKDNLAIQSEREIKPAAALPKAVQTPKTAVKPDPGTALKDKKSAVNQRPSSQGVKNTTKEITVEANTPSDKTSGSNTTCAIQIGALSKKIDPDSRAFKGIKPIRMIFLGGKYKYICYETDTFQDTKANFDAVKKNFPDAFIVSVKDNQTKFVWNGRGK